jgi:cytochrome P450
MNLICNGTLAFIENPGEWERLRADPDAAARLATEECLRYDPPVKSTQRIAAEDVERRGKVIRKGDRLRWFMAAANRDPRAFEDPDRFDIGRQPNTHVSFGAGIHYCSGRAGADRRAGGLSARWRTGFARLRPRRRSWSTSRASSSGSLSSLPVA